MKEITMCIIVILIKTITECLLAFLLSAVIALFFAVPIYIIVEGYDFYLEWHNKRRFEKEYKKWLKQNER